jgi:hypothetical protein
MKTLFFKTDKQNQTTFECLFESKQTAKNNKSLKTYMKSLFFKTGKQKHQVYSCNLDSKMIFNTYVGCDQSPINPGLTSWLINALTKLKKTNLTRRLLLHQQDQTHPKML